MIAIKNRMLPTDYLTESAKLLVLTQQSLHVQTGLIDGELACAWGLMPPTFMSNHAHLWLYTTDLVKEHTFIFIRQSQIAVEKMLEDYDELHGEVEDRNHKAIRWLGWLGARFAWPDNGRIPFVIERKP